MTEASSGYLSSHSSAGSRQAPHLRPTDVPEPRNAKILAPTLTTTSPSQGSSCQAPGLARQYASSSSHVIASSPDRRLRVERDGEPGDGSVAPGHLQRATSAGVPGEADHVAITVP